MQNYLKHALQRNVIALSKVSNWLRSVDEIYREIIDPEDDEGGTSDDDDDEGGINNDDNWIYYSEFCQLYIDDRGLFPLPGKARLKNK